MEFTEQLARVSELQKNYSSENTPDMQERGHLIRHQIPEYLENYIDQFKTALGKHSHDLKIQGRDGIGRKTEAPWVRIYSENLSPSATDGFYLVIHFSIDGSRVYVTIGCSASRWDSSKGDLVKHSNAELDRRVLWALSTLEAAGCNVDQFNDHINLGSRLALPKSFERATVLAKVFDPADIGEQEFVNCIAHALELLAVIYDSCEKGAHLLWSEIDQTRIDEAVHPEKINRNARQGFGLTVPERRAVEIQAMKVTTRFLESAGYEVKDVSSNSSFDLLATKDGDSLKVEVKGSTASALDSLLMTSNEVELHKNEAGTTALAIVKAISLAREETQIQAYGGELEYLFPWDISRWKLRPIAYQVFVPPEEE